MKKVFVAAAIVLGTISFTACTETKTTEEGTVVDSTSTMTTPESMPTDTTTIAPAADTTVHADTTAH